MSCNRINPRVYLVYLLFSADFFKMEATGGMAQLARASALQAEGQGFESPCLQNDFSHDAEVAETEADSEGMRIIIWSSEIRVHGGCLGAARRRRT